MALLLYGLYVYLAVMFNIINTGRRKTGQSSLKSAERREKENAFVFNMNLNLSQKKISNNWTQSKGLVGDCHT